MKKSLHLIMIRNWNIDNFLSLLDKGIGLRASKNHNVIYGTYLHAQTLKYPLFS